MSAPGNEVRERRASRAVAVTLCVSILTALGAMVTYALGGQTQIEGVLLGVALGGIGTGLVIWSKRLLAPDVTVAERYGPSPEADREAAEDALESGVEQIERRKLLTRLLLGAFGALGLAAVFPIRSLGPAPGDTLNYSPWQSGKRLVDENGEPIPADRLDVGGVLTVFPEGAVSETDKATGQAMLVKVDPGDYQPMSGRADWIAAGNLAYSKVCTHAGCPVGLYQAASAELTCPCHRSTFLVTHNAAVVFGPAGRALPQLPLSVDRDGNLIATGGFSDAVGPAFWNLTPQPQPSGA